ncbi:MAG: hypothetical protein HQ564_06365 [Candidatus Saganbacteria bacterium]|nr:hypothetical protein [Candidatus Saganbacteria bacterium]
MEFKLISFDAEPHLLQGSSALVGDVLNRIQSFEGDPKVITTYLRSVGLPIAGPLIPRMGKKKIQDGVLRAFFKGVLPSNIPESLKATILEFLYAVQMDKGPDIDDLERTFAYSVQLLLGDPSKINDLYPFLDGTDTEVIPQAAIAVARYGEIDRALSVIENVISGKRGDVDEYWLISAVTRISQIPDIAVIYFDRIKNLALKVHELAMQKDEYSENRNSQLLDYLGILTNLENSAASPLVTPFLEDTDEKIRISAADAMRRFGWMEEALEVARPLLNNNIKNRSMGGGKSIINYDGPEARLIAAKIVGLLGDLAAAEKALEPLSGNWNINLRVVDVLSQIGLKEKAFELLGSLLEQVPDGFLSQSFILSSFWKHGDRSRMGEADRLIRMNLDPNKDWWSRIRLIGRLAEIGDPEVFKYFSLAKDIELWRLLQSVISFIQNYGVEQDVAIKKGK